MKRRNSKKNTKKSIASILIIIIIIIIIIITTTFVDKYRGENEREREMYLVSFSLAPLLSDVAPWRSSVKAFSRRDRKTPSLRGRTDRRPLLLLGRILSTNALFSSPRIFSPA